MAQDTNASVSFHHGSGITINEHYKVIDTKHGLMLINQHDPAITSSLDEKGEWAWNEIELTIPYATGIVLDIGANIGTHTLVYARTADQVFAFEPQPLAFDNLCTNLLLNNVINVTPVQCALGSYDGHTTMRLQEPTVFNSSAGVQVGTGSFAVAMRTLDSIEVPPVSFIKIDVEGHELEVLHGASETLKRDMPVLYVEIHSMELIGRVGKFLEEGLGYVGKASIITSIEYPTGQPLTEDLILYTYGYLFQREGENEHEA